METVSSGESSGPKLPRLVKCLNWRWIAVTASASTSCAHGRRAGYTEVGWSAVQELHAVGCGSGWRRRRARQVAHAGHAHVHAHARRRARRVAHAGHAHAHAHARRRARRVARPTAGRACGRLVAWSRGRAPRWRASGRSKTRTLSAPAPGSPPPGLARRLAGGTRHTVC